jgi:predicted Zn-dependent protease
MRFENRTPPEGINTSEHRPLREFLKLSLAALLLISVVGVLLIFTGGLLGGLLPFRAELWITERVDRIMQQADQASPFDNAISDSINNADATDNPLHAYLQSISDQVVSAMELPEPMRITLHYSDDDVFNAYATLGGHVYLFKGLLKHLPNENALTMLMAHEFAHVEERHPAKSVGGGLTLAVGSSMLFGAAAFENRFFSMASALASTQYSRAMETDADQVALAAVNAIYGHVNGADDLFELFEIIRAGQQADLLEPFFSTHPLDNQRIQSIEKQAIANGWFQQGNITPLPEDFLLWLNDH